MFHRKKINSLLIASATAALLLSISVGAGACGGKDSTGTSGPLQHPTGKNQVVLRVSSGGGFVPPEVNLKQVPEFTLYGDGTVIVTGPTTMIYPGAALPNLQTTTVTQKTIQAILSAAQEAGLLQASFDYGNPGISDVPTTTITVNVGGKTYESSIYALGVEAAGGSLTMEQQQARAAVSTFVGKLTGLESFQQGLQWSAYQFNALRVYSSAATASGATDVQPNKLAWPLGDLATLGQPTQPDGFRVFAVSGSDLATLQPLLGQATEITLWSSGGKEYNLAFRPLLPDETA